MSLLWKNGTVEGTGAGSAGSAASESHRVDPPPSGGTVVSPTYLDVLVGNGVLTLTQKKMILEGKLTPESLVVAGTINANQFAALTGQNYTTPGGLGSAAMAWSTTLLAQDGALVVFNGSLYQAIGAPAAGTIPPVEVATPVNPALGARYRLLARGRSECVPWDMTVQYYRDQVVSHLGGRYRCETPTATKATAPSSDSAEWVAEFQGMTSREQTSFTSQTATPNAVTTNLSAVTANLLSVTTVQRQSGDALRVKRFELRATNHGSNVVSAGSTLFNFGFPVPFPANKTPSIKCFPQSVHAAARAVGVVPTFDGNGRCTGFSCYNGLATVASDVIDLRIEVDENPGQ